MGVWVVTLFEEIEQIVFESREDAYKLCWRYLTEARAEAEAEGEDGFWWTARMRDLDDIYFATEDGDFGVEDIFEVKLCQMFKKGEYDG